MDKFRTTNRITIRYEDEDLRMHLFISTENREANRNDIDKIIDYLRDQRYELRS